MDPPPPNAAALQTQFYPDPTPPQKLRLLCSHGGHIAPRPHDKALCYVGGETRIVAVDRRTARSFPFISAHLSHILLNGRPFYLKYQLPDHDLDSLVSITSDEDLANMIDEFDRLSLSPHAGRLRFFLFPAKPCPSESDIHDPQSETWFLDALRTTGFGDSGCPGNGVEGGGDSEGKGALETGSGSGPEVILLETSLSFESTESSDSSTNLPATRVCGEGSTAHVDLKGTLAPVDSIGSDSSLASPNFQPQNVFYADSVANLGYDNKAPQSSIDTESHVSDLSPKADLLIPIHVKACQLLQTTNQSQVQSPPSPLPLLHTQPQSSQHLCLHAQPQTVVCTDAIGHPDHKYNSVCSHTIETGSSALTDFSSKTNLLKKVQVVGYPLAALTDLLQQQPQTVVRTDAVSHPDYNDNKFCSRTIETESSALDFSSRAKLLKKVQVVGYPLAAQTDILQQQPKPRHLLHPQLTPQPQAPLQYVHPGPHYMSQYYTSPATTASYPTVYQLNKPYGPFYLMPGGQAQAYDISMQGHVAGASSVAASNPPKPSSGMMVATPVVYEGLTSAPPATEHAATVYRTTAVASALPTASSDEHEQQLVAAYPLTNETSQSVLASVAASTHCIGGYEDPVHAQIYKSQPPAPVLSSRFQALTNATTAMVLE